jgi:hypothetical protein
MGGADLSHPNLRVRMPGEETIRGRDLIPVDLVVGGLDIDERILPFILGLEARKHFAFINLVAAPGDLLSTVSTLP